MVGPEVPAWAAVRPVFERNKVQPILLQHINRSGPAPRSAEVSERIVEQACPES